MNSTKSTPFQRHQLERISDGIACNTIPVKVIKSRNYKVCDVTLSGDAPKGFLRIYQPTRHSWHRRNISRWPQYIVKTGHKWYPNESLTEFLLNQLGRIFGLNMAESDIAIINGQLRFLSKYFLKQGQQLIHGAEIFAGYIGDIGFVEQIEDENLSRDLFTLQFVEKAVAHCFTDQAEMIMHELVKLLLYDALVGNNDRHFYNWGVIKSSTRAKDVIFAPVYDTARGLFWNDNEDKLKMKSNPHDKPIYINKYSIFSRPKLGWNGEHNINHFKLVELIYNNEFHIKKQEIKDLLSRSVIESMKNYVSNDCKMLFSATRKEMIISCLEHRFNQIQKLLA